MRRVLRGVTILLLCLLMPARSVSAWEADVHYGLTLWLAERLKFPPPVARAIAEGNLGADSFIHDARTLVVYVCTRDDDATKKVGSYEVAKYHFPWIGNLPTPPPGRQVTADGAAARAWYRDLIHRNPPRSTDDSDRHRRDFGAALHVLQDSFSHAGEPGVVCEPGYSWGHPNTRGGPLEHFADHTYYDGGSAKGIDLTRGAALATYKALQEYQSKYLRPAPASLTPRDLAVIEQFAKASTKFQKRNVLNDMAIKESDLFRICELTIAGPGCSKSEWVKRTWNWLIAKVPPVLDATVNKFFYDFFTSWVLEKDLTKTAATFVELDTGSVKFYQLPAATPDVVGGLLGLWLFTDHSVAQQNRHGAKMDARKATVFINAQPPDRISVTSPFEAFVPIDKAETWFQVLSVPNTKDDYVAVAQFRHTPYDMVIVRAKRNAQRDWRIVRLWWEITH